MKNASESTMVKQRNSRWTRIVGWGTLSFPIASWLAGFFFGSTKFVDEATRFRLDMAFLAHDEHAMAVAAGIWPPWLPPSQRDFKEIVSDLIDCRRSAGCPDGSRTNDSTIATDAVRSRILSTASKFLASPTDNPEPAFLSPYFSQYGSASVSAASLFMENNRLESRMREVFDESMDNIDLPAQATVSDVLMAVLKNMAERCPELRFFKTETESEIILHGYMDNQRDQNTHLPEFTVDTIPTIASTMPDASPNEIFEKLKKEGLIRYSQSTTNFCIEIPRTPEIDSF